MKYFLILVILFTPLIVRADQPRFSNLFTGTNDKFELRVDVDYWNWSLIEKETKKNFINLREI